MRFLYDPTVPQHTHGMGGWWFCTRARAKNSPFTYVSSHVVCAMPCGVCVCVCVVFVFTLRGWKMGRYTHVVVYSLYITYIFYIYFLCRLLLFVYIFVMFYLLRNIMSLRMSQDIFFCGAFCRACTSMRHEYNISDGLKIKFT